MKRRSVVFAAVACATLSLAAFQAAQGATLRYDLYQMTPDTLPPNGPWVNSTGTAPDTADVNTPNTLTLNNPNGGSGFHWDNAAAIPGGFLASQELTIIARMKVTTSTLPDWAAIRADFLGGGKWLGIGASLNGSTAAFFITGDISGTRFSRRVDVPVAPVGADGFYNVMVHKNADTNSNPNDDALTFTIDGVNVLVYNPLFNVNDWGTLAGAGGTQTFWGQYTSNASEISSGQFTGVSYGIGQSALVLLPEPSAITTLLFAAGSVLLRRRQSH